MIKLCKIFVLFFSYNYFIVLFGIFLITFSGTPPTTVWAVPKASGGIFPGDQLILTFETSSYHPGFYDINAIIDHYLD